MGGKAFFEFVGIELGDKRLEKRATNILEKIQTKPDETFPRMFSASELEAFYRFVESPYVCAEAILKPHVESTLKRLEGVVGEVLVVHDTTEFVFSGNRRNLAHHCERRDFTSFFGHFSMAMDWKAGRPLGILGMHTWVRDDKFLTPTARRRQGISRKKLAELPSEMDRWFKAMKQSATLIGDQKSPIHVCDSEADNYALFAQLIAQNHRFIIRGCRDRRLEDSPDKLRQVLEKQPVFAQRSVQLSCRTKNNSDKRRKPRETRTANLAIRLCQVRTPRPYLASKTLFDSLDLNVVYVLEEKAPENCEPVEWILLTTEPVSTSEEALRVVDMYRNRWIIEEYFKALKTGCAYETRQLESYETLLNCLALFVPIAWLMLLMRSESRRDSSESPTTVLPPLFLEVLRLYSMKALHTIQEALLAVAALGGHIKNNGPPGWLVLWRGLRELATLTRGFAIARKYLVENVNEKM